MDATTTPSQLITCAGCGTQVPITDSFYVDGAGQLCITTCTAPCPQELIDIAPPSNRGAASGVPKSRSITFPGDRPGEDAGV